MKAKRGDAARTGAVALVNRQRGYTIPGAFLAAFVHRLRQQLRLAREEFNICFVDDQAIRRLNSTFRSRDRATDVLSFPWTEAKGSTHPAPRSARHRWKQHGISNFLGEVVISIPAARRNAAQEGHSTLREIQWLILHGILHLLGYDHERDSGEMVALELALREKLGMEGLTKRSKPRGQSRKTKVQPASR